MEAAMSTRHFAFALLVALVLGVAPGALEQEEQAAVGNTERVSVSTGGTQANWQSYSPSVSADGRYVAFSSGASNLVPGDTARCPPDPICWDVFVRDRVARITERVSVAQDGTERAAAQQSASVSRPRAGRPTARATLRRSAAADASSRSSPWRRISCPGTPTA
jgi:hypothetical protein